MTDRYGKGDGAAARLSRDSGQSESLLSQWLNDHVKDPSNLSVGKVLSVARALGVRPEWLVLGEGARLEGAELQSHDGRLEREKVVDAVRVLDRIAEYENHDKISPEQATRFAIMYEVVFNEEERPHDTNMLKFMTKFSALRRLSGG